MTGDMANLRAPGFSLDRLKLLVSCQGVFQKLNGATSAAEEVHASTLPPNRRRAL